MQNIIPAETDTGFAYLLTESAARKSAELRYKLILAAIFVGALAVRVWFNFAADHPNCAGCCDASEYVRNAAALSSMLSLPQEFWHKFFNCAVGTASQTDLESVRAYMSGLKEVYQAGPVFPIFLTISFSVAGFLFADNPFGAPVLVQSILSAVACCLITDFSSKAWSRPVGYTAGLLAAVYPGFIVNSGRLYTESFATFVVCVVLALVVRGFFTVKNVVPRAFALGFLSACLQLTRSILVITSLCMVPILIVQQYASRWKSGLVSLLLGFACVVVPWVSFQHVAFDKGGIVVDRVGNYNLFIGSNTQTQGWLTFPYPDGRGIEKSSLPNLLAQSYKTSPSRFIRLMLDKPARLFQMPWNDFRTSIGWFDVGAQSLLHQFVLLCAGLGLLIALFTNVGRESPNRAQIYSRVVLLGFALVHLIYVLFITVPRYALTSMPVVIAFSAAGLASVAALLAVERTRQIAVRIGVAALAFWVVSHTNFVQPLMDSGICNSAVFALGMQSLAKLGILAFLLFSIWMGLEKTSGYRRLARILTTMCFLLAIPLMVLPGRAAGRWYEWQKPLIGDAVTQTLTLPASIGDQQTYLMIDTDGASSLNSADVIVNGKKLDGPVIPGLAVAQDYSVLQHVTNKKVTWEGENIFNFMTKPADTSNAELRQWFLIPVPTEITAGAKGQLSVKVARKVSASEEIVGILYGSYHHGKELYIPSVTTYSWEKAFYGVENEAGLTDPRLDQSIHAPLARTAEPNIRLLIPSTRGNVDPGTTASLVLKPHPTTDALTSAAALSSATRVTSLKQVPIPPFELTAKSGSKPFAIYTMPAYAKDDLWIVRATGSIKSKNSAARPSMLLRADCNLDGNRYETPWTPNFIWTSTAWSRFDIAVPIAPGRLPGGIKQLQGEFVYNVPKWKTVGSVPDDLVQVKDLKLEIVRLPGNPLARGFSIQ
ncbi:MAG: hypothetical protein EKK48_23675 [Candidatus Melainabacteria bacterium]|nr:MAG: hypothetical protein EKK48_23675 [Candidatus Melainabacteria bacterium]